ncbi:sulfate permease [Pseudanabaena sp. FACHB-1998]|uniref:SulP family inorganic anion transporter n=1 Tax=Pseudanabaena sp. FACHB-1998 TaxID=2692858 RepID=UPI0016811BE9|nr:sulfate permease [Pseudanabaena sp. FACHB-1998]MBD2175469.1 sulfate permease [Pseudanabaena sp. FACHB-1998]
MPNLPPMPSLPAWEWMQKYQSQYLLGDITAGIVVTSLLIPQSMAYALLAGLPPQVGLYASIVPAIAYPLFGTSKVLAVGPVAVSSLMVAAAIAKLAPQGTEAYLTLALTIAFLVGAIAVVMGILRMGFLVNFLSRAVISGFISGALIIVIVSQLDHLLGLGVPTTTSFIETLIKTLSLITHINRTTAILGLGSVAILLYFNQPLVNQLKQLDWSEAQILPISKGAPLLVVILGTLITFSLQLDQTQAVEIVGAIPAGLSGLTMPIFDQETWLSLLSAALAIAIVGYMEGFAGGQAIATKRMEKIDPNQELIAFGIANISAAFSGGYPVTGAVSRSMVSFSAGANTGLASMITGVFAIITLLFFTSWFYFLPQTCLAAIIIMAVYKLIDFATLKRMWNYDKADAIAWIATFVAVLLWDVQAGIILGAMIAIALHLYRTSQPHIAIVGRMGDSADFRDILRHEVKTNPQILAIRIDANLYFANAQYVQNFINQAISDRPDDQPEVTSILLVCSAINFIDTSALEMLESLIATFKSLNINFYFSEVKSSVMDKLEPIGFVDLVGRDRFFLSTDLAMRELSK